MISEGKLRLGLHLGRGLIEKVAVDSTRPVSACSVFQGRTVEEALRIIPTVYSICGTAQGLAALAACEGAAGLVPDQSQAAGRRLLLLSETAREHTWRVVLDWAGLLGEQPDPLSLAPLRRPLGLLPPAIYPKGDWTRPGGGSLEIDRGRANGLLTEFASALVEIVLGDSWLEVEDLDGLRAWGREGHSAAARLIGQVLGNEELSTLGASDVEPMPAWDLAVLDQRLEADTERTWVAKPDWNGAVFETGPLARVGDDPLVAAMLAEYGNGLATRLVARLVELAGLPGEMAEWVSLIAADGGQDFPVNAEGIGLAAIEAARGRLAHRVELDAGRISRYQILAPTEWNFHPDGPLARGLAGTSAQGDPSRKADWVVMALDPCVGCEVAIHA